MTTGLVTNPQDQIESIRTLLEDSYPYDDGRTLRRELVQNADDAGATRLHFVVIADGNQKAENPLLKGPALIVANDGPFRPEDEDAMHRAVGGNKREEAQKVGRFGLGMKSVFHICEAFLYWGADGNGAPAFGILNPWTGTGGIPNNDPVNQKWNSIGDNDRQVLSSVADKLLKGRSRQQPVGFLMWLPLRKEAHVNRGQDGGHYGLRSNHFPTPDEITCWFHQREQYALLVAQTGGLAEICATRGKVGDRCEFAAGDVPLLHVRRGGGKEGADTEPWVSRHRESAPNGQKHETKFGGVIQIEGEPNIASTTWRVVGADVLGCRDFQERHQEPEKWPRYSVPGDNGTYRVVPQKAIPHAALSVLHSGNSATNAKARVRLRWAVFYALHDGPEPADGVGEIFGDEDAGHTWDIILHGYFFPSHDRRSIPGVTVEDQNASVHAEWNKDIVQKLLFPSFARVIETSVKDLNADVAAAYLKLVARLKATTEAMKTATEGLFPIAGRDGVTWSVVDNNTELFGVPEWHAAPQELRHGIADRFAAPLLFDASSPFLEPASRARAPTEQADHLAKLLRCVGGVDRVWRDHQSEAKAVQWIGSLLEHRRCRAHKEAEVAAHWIVAMMAGGALKHPSQMDDPLRQAWTGLFGKDKLPAAWVLNIPMNCSLAVMKLAKLANDRNAGPAIGPGFLMLPFGGGGGNQQRNDWPEEERVVSAVRQLGEWLHDKNCQGEDRKSAIALATQLLSLQHIGWEDHFTPGSGMAKLPLLRTRTITRDGGQEEEVVSFADLGAGQPTVFRSSNRQGEVAELKYLLQATGLKSFRLLDARLPRALTHTVPQVTEDTLAQHVVDGPNLAPSPRDRLDLMGHLLQKLQAGPPADVKNALRKLVCGSQNTVPQPLLPLFATAQNHDNHDIEKSAKILLGLQGHKWRLVPNCLSAELNPNQQVSLGIQTVDDTTLTNLVRDTVHQVQADGWGSIGDADRRHLILHIHDVDRIGIAWKSMPIHRMQNGTRGPITQTVFRVAQDGQSPQMPDAIAQRLQVIAPEAEVAMLSGYQDIPALEAHRVLELMLREPKPHLHYAHILPMLRDVWHQGNLDVTWIGSRPWLPSQDANRAIAPESILMVPDQLVGSLPPLQDGYWPHSDVRTDVWTEAHDIIRDLIDCRDVAEQVGRIIRAIDRASLANGFILPELHIGDGDGTGNELVTVLRVAIPCLERGHRGWNLLGRVAQTLNGHGAAWADRTRDTFLQFYRNLTGDVPPQMQQQMLSNAAPDGNQGPDTIFFELVQCFSGSGPKNTQYALDTFYQQVRDGHIKFPTQDGHWRAADEIARTSQGVSRSHLLPEKYRAPLGLDGAAAVNLPQQNAAGANPGQNEHTWAQQSSAQALEAYFKSWKGHVADSAVGAFLALLGRGETRELAQQWLGNDIDIDAMLCKAYQVDNPDKVPQKPFHCSHEAAADNQATVQNLLGEEKCFDRGNGDSLLIEDPTNVMHAGGHYWNPKTGKVDREFQPQTPMRFWWLRFRDIDPGKYTADYLSKLLLTAITQIRRTADPQSPVLKIDKWWSSWATGSQAQVAPVRALILSQLPLTLRQLSVADHRQLNEALCKTERAQKLRAQALPDRIGDAFREEHNQLRSLDRLITEDDPPGGDPNKSPRGFLLGRVREIMRRYGYDEESILLELAQNADDALSQADEIARKEGTALTDESRVLTIHYTGGDPAQLEVIHYGRPINDCGPPNLHGESRQWDQDLYFMALMNLSAKPGEAGPHADAAPATTGKFGLGFKSVHLASDQPEVVSGFLSFSFVGGLLPQEQPVPSDVPGPKDGHRATRVRLPLRPEVGRDQLFNRFNVAKPLLPAFARQIGAITVDENGQQSVAAYTPVAVPGAVGWSYSKDPIPFPDVGFPDGRMLRVLRFRPSDNPDEHHGAKQSTAIAVALDDDWLPTKMPKNTPFLWNVAPTDDRWGCAYAVNGPFKIDPGRNRVTIDHRDTVAIIRDLGERLGAGLLQLHTALGNEDGNAPNGLPAGRDFRTKFFCQLWAILTEGIIHQSDSPLAFLRFLHGEEQHVKRGLARLVREKPVVPTGLPAPFPPTTQWQNGGGGIRVASGCLSKPEMCEVLNEIDWVREELQHTPVVAAFVWQRLSRLLDVGQEQKLTMKGVITARLDSHNCLITADFLHSFRPLAGQPIEEILRENPQAFTHKLHAVSEGRQPQPMRNLLVPPPPADTPGPADDHADEFRRARFAPPENRLAAGYIENDDDVRLFVRIRGPHQVGAAVIASWYTDGLDDTSRRYAMEYLLRGDLQSEVLRQLQPEASRPTWLRDRQGVQDIIEKIGEVDGAEVDQWEKDRLLSTLFPPEPQPFLGDNGAHEDQEDWMPFDQEQCLDDAQRQRFFQNFANWWAKSDNRQTVIAWHEEGSWPASLRNGNGLRVALKEDESRPHWLALLFLGACQSLGRTTSAQHRSFVEKLVDDGTWKTLSDRHNREDPTQTDTEWMNHLRNWIEPQIDDQPYQVWIDLFPRLYQLSRYLDQYRNLLMTAGSRDAEYYHHLPALLAPRADPALSGTGSRFNAPPMPLGIGAHWILRELVRLDCTERAEHLFPVCWVPSRRLLTLFGRLGLKYDDGAPSHEKAKCAHDFVRDNLSQVRHNSHQCVPAYLDYAFDIPFLYMCDKGKDDPRLQAVIDVLAQG